MDRIPVESSNLSALGYNISTSTLEIEFNDGSVYQYSDVPLNVYEELMAAGSHGKYFHANIRNVYPCTKI